MNNAERVKGGSFLIEEPDPAAMFTPEDFSDEHHMIAQLTEDFVDGEVLPLDGRIEAQNDWSLTVNLLRKAGSLGLLGAEVPEGYGGLDLDKASATLITEKLVRASSFALSHGAHVGIGSLPIVLFGTDEQKKKYLPKLASGEWISAYCLTEPSSGSDAMAARTQAVLTSDGAHYVLNGSKQFITNAGFADVFIVYAKVDGEHFTAFIVERNSEGLSTGPEEKKMGIKGSSTRPLILEDVKVPVNNVLGEIGRGHIIAFNILNIGRYKLAAGCVGTSKWALELSLDYGKQRKQFGKELVQFPLVSSMLADMAIRTFAAESMVYRTCGYFDAAMGQLDKGANDYSRQVAQAVAEYAMECSINKVFATEALDMTADEGVQIHGGYGYIQEYMIERIYRDSRINRIFEGTNEINRLLIPGTLLKRALKGELPLMEAAGNLQQELVTYMPPLFSGDEPLEQEKEMIRSAKKIFLMVGGSAVQKFQLELEQQQEVLKYLADIIIAIYAMESAWLRAKKNAQRDQTSANLDLQTNYTQVIVHEHMVQIEQRAKQTLTAVETGDVLQVQLSILRKLTRFPAVNLTQVKRQIAKQLVKAGAYKA